MDFNIFRSFCMCVCVYVNNVTTLMSGMADTLKAIFPPFPIPGFVPNFTGYDVDQKDIDWYDMYEKTAAIEDSSYVRTTSVNYF